MLFDAWATTSPTAARTRYSQLTLTSPVSRAAPTASTAPIRPDVAVIENTAAGVMTSHLLIASGGAVMPSGRFAVLKMYRHVARRPSRATGTVEAGVGREAGLVAIWSSGRA